MKYHACLAPDREEVFRAHETRQSTSFEATHRRRLHWLHLPLRKAHVLARGPRCLRRLRDLPARLQVLVVSPQLSGRKAALSTVSRYLIRAGTGLALGYAVLTAYLLIRVKPVPITMIPERGGAGEGESAVHPATSPVGVRGCY